MTEPSITAPLEINFQQATLLANAIGALAVSAGIITTAEGLTGPQLLMLADDIRQEIERTNAKLAKAHPIFRVIPFECGNEYETYAGKIVKIVQRSMTRGYECVLGDDDKWRYNRLNDMGRCTGTDHQLHYEHNLIPLYVANVVDTPVDWMLVPSRCTKEMLAKASLLLSNGGSLADAICAANWAVGPIARPTVMTADQMLTILDSEEDRRQGVYELQKAIKKNLCTMEPAGERVG